ncbi:VanZ family protein [Paenibacillus sp. R14(2021)]|uniref:VanZ family protein n=1 Tax=Paenibacillus sp. R14(2021) TaxID=2859228 RepID=UPI001C615A51|nr:VanZ family protein [Paenibacillus sp. R14(2021)]
MLKWGIAIAWAVLLAILTCTDSLRQLYFTHDIHFDWNPSPDYGALWSWSDINLIHKYWIVIKFGHFTGFLIMEALLYQLIRNGRVSACIAAGFAVLTEILQLYFYRDGRVYDILIDTAGIMTFYYVKRASSFLKLGASTSTRR